MRVIAERRAHSELYPESYRSTTRLDWLTDASTGVGQSVRVEIPGEPRHLRDRAVVMARGQMSSRR
jgi:hypothetical protein